MLLYRKANVADVEKLVELKDFFTKHLMDESLVEWLIEDDSKIVATGEIQFYEFPPSYTNISGIRGYVSHMYTAPDYRMRGLAQSLLDRVVQEARQRGIIQLFLYASELGKPVYLKYGFIEKNEWMELKI